MHNTNPSFQEELRTNGYRLLPNRMLSDTQYQDLYKRYHALFYNPTYKREKKILEECSEQWNNTPHHRKAYIGAPMGFNDRRVRADKDEKTYFQYSCAFGESIRTHSAYSSSILLPQFLSLLDTVEKITEECTEEALQELQTDFPKSIATLFPPHSPRRLILKVICYHPTTSCATNIHYDKSALTVVHHGSDMKDDPFCIGPYQPEASPSTIQLHTPSRYQPEETTPGTGLLFPGLLFHHTGIQVLPPSPHGVKELTDKTTLRYATIGFLLIPELEVEKVPTKVYT